METNKISGWGGGSRLLNDIFCRNNCLERQGSASNNPFMCGQITQATLPNGLKTTLKYCQKHGWIGSGGGGFASGIGNSWRATGGGGLAQNEY